MSRRTTKGQLTAEALRQGHVEQYAAVRAFGVVVVEMRAVKNRWIVQLTITNEGRPTLGRAAFYPRLNEARRAFAGLSRKALKSDQPGLIGTGD